MRAGGALVAALWAVATAAVAHDTFIVPPATVTAGRPVVVQITSSGFFPEPETRIRPERMSHVDARVGGSPVTWTATADDVAMTFTTAPAPAAAPAVIVVSLSPWDIDVEPEVIDEYMDEIGADPALRAQVAASVAADGALRETYTKHLKTLVCAATCADNAAPGADTFEFIADAAQPGRFTLFLKGRALANQPVVLRNARGEHRTLTTDADGSVDTPAFGAGLLYLSTVQLLPPAAPGARFTSQWASLTFDARLLGE